MNYKHPKINIFYNLLVMALIFLVSYSCGSNKAVSTSKDTSKVEQTPKIVFLNYAIKKNNTGSNTIQFISSKKVNGKLKNQKKILVDKGDPGDLLCLQLDATSATISQLLIKNPLQKTVEYVDETKNFKVVNMALDSTEFFVRLQLYPETKFIAINNSLGSKKPLILTKVSEL